LRAHIELCGSAAATKYVRPRDDGSFSQK
jgi:hypothetical protein